jgi:hypothetical protein
VLEPVIVTFVAMPPLSINHAMLFMTFILLHFHAWFRPGGEVLRGPLCCNAATIFAITCRDDWE